MQDVNTQGPITWAVTGTLTSGQRAFDRIVSSFDSHSINSDYQQLLASFVSSLYTTDGHPCAGVLSAARQTAGEN